MIHTIPSHLSEAVHGALMIKLADAAYRSAAFVWYQRKKSRSENCSFYTKEIKAAIALTTMWIGLDLTIGSIWWLLHMRNHGGDQDFAAGPWLLVGGAGMATWGCICWARSTEPDNGHFHTWIPVTLFAIAFGVWFAI